MMQLSVAIFSLHYFFYFAALSPIYGFISVYATHYSNATSSQYGVLNMILPFVTIFAKVFFCSLADRHRAHRSIFLCFQVLSLIGYGSFGILPFFIEKPSGGTETIWSYWIIICIMTSVATVSMAVMSCLSDTFAMHVSKQGNLSFGYIRLWGTLGWAICSLALMYINGLASLPYLVPGLLLSIMLFAADLLMITLCSGADDFDLNPSESCINPMNDSAICRRRHENLATCCDPKPDAVKEQTSKRKKDISDLKIQFILLKEVLLERKSVFRYMFLFTVSGAVSALQWSYFFKYLEEIHAPKYFAVITGLSMLCQALLGELPFFILAGFIIRVLGRLNTLNLSIACLGVRYILYEYLLRNNSPYFVILTETLQGPCFGLFYVVMNEIALEYAQCEKAIIKVVDEGLIEENPQAIQKLRQVLRATMQSLMSACYEGLGVGLGSIVGGLVIDNRGFSKLWIWSATLALVVVTLNIAIEKLRKMRNSN